LDTLTSVIELAVGVVTLAAGIELARRALAPVWVGVGVLVGLAGTVAVAHALLAMA
jgi:hypothetical protein